MIFKWAETGVNGSVERIANYAGRYRFIARPIGNSWHLWFLDEELGQDGTGFFISFESLEKACEEWIKTRSTI